MIPGHQIAGAILAGGKSSRMGEDKALLPLDGKPMIQYVADAMCAVFEEVAVISDAAESYRFLGLPVVPDVYKERGPLAGIHAALKQSKADKVFVVACDAPFVSTDLIEFVTARQSHSSIIVVSEAGEVQPLFGIYSKEVLPVVEEMLSSGFLRLRDLLKKTGAEIVPLSPELSKHRPSLFQNINTPADFRDSVSRHA